MARKTFTTEQIVGSIADGMQFAFIVAGALMIAALWISRWEMGSSEHAEL